MKTVNATIELITPQMAEEWLKKNPKNRTMKERKVNRLVNTIRKNQWQLNGDAIRFSRDGTLIDGQHRLAAIMVSKQTCQSFVIRGLSPDTITTIDIGNARNLGDHLKIQGYGGAVYALAAAVTLCLCFKKDGTYSDWKEKFSPDDALDFLKENKGILKSFELLAPNKEFRDLLPNSASIATHYLFKKIDRESAEKFFHFLMTGEKLGAKSPILKLRTQLIALRKETKRSGHSRKVFLHFLTTAFQAYLNDERIDSLPPYKEDTKVTLPKVRK